MISYLEWSHHFVVFWNKPVSIYVIELSVYLILFGNVSDFFFSYTDFYCMNYFSAILSFVCSFWSALFP